MSSAVEEGERFSFYLPVFVTGILFLGVQVAALLLVPQYKVFGYQAFGPQGQTNPLIPLLYVAVLILFTALMIYILKKRKGNWLRAIFIFVISLSAIYVLLPVFVLAFPSLPDVDFYLSVLAMILIGAALWRYPEWYVVDTWGFIMASGITAIFGISLGILPSFVLLSVMAAYDFLAVYRTKHMLDVAEGALDLNLPIMLMVPKKSGFSNFRKKGSVVRSEVATERDALYIGLGDMIIPGVLTISAFSNLSTATVAYGLAGNLLVALGCITGAIAGFAVLMRQTSKGRAQAGLPFLNTGTILGFLLSYMLVFHNLGFGFVFSI
jgi:presenilin-like A22 family membrane protease